MLQDQHEDTTMIIHSDTDGFDHKIELFMRGKCECAIADKKFISIDFQCNLAINALLFCYIFGFFIPVFKVLTNRWICFWYAMSVLKWYFYVPLQDFFSTQQLA